MELIMHQISEDYLRYKQTLCAFETEWQSLPKGSLICRRGKGRCYYSIEVRNVDGIRHSKAVDIKNVELVKRDFSRKKFLEVNIKILRRHIKIVEKAYPEVKALENTLQNAQKMYLTYKGDYVRSKSELIIANELYINQISYDYEKPLFLKGMTKPIHPDFTIYTPQEHRIIYWEHCGLMSDIEYRSKWERRKQLYEDSNISEWQKNLIVTYEAQNGDFCVEEIERHINRLLRC